MSERSPEQGRFRELGHSIRGLEFDIESRIQTEASSEQRERAGGKSNWRDAFNNKFSIIAARIDAASMGIDTPLPVGKEAQITDLTDRIIKEARVNRTDEEAIPVIRPMLVELADLFD